MKTAVLFLTAFLFLCLAEVVASQLQYDNKCSKEDAIAAEEEAPLVKNWDELYQSFKPYAPRCDSGSIAEGYSDSVGRLLVSKWEELNDLHNLILTDDDFRRFVFRHIDITIPAATLKTITEKAETRCPAGLEQFCGSIKAHITNIKD
jgi:hypothetical protein